MPHHLMSVGQSVIFRVYVCIYIPVYSRKGTKSKELLPGTISPQVVVSVVVLISPRDGYKEDLQSSRKCSSNNRYQIFG